MRALKVYLGLFFVTWQMAIVYNVVNITSVKSQFNPAVCSQSYCMMSNTRGNMKYINFGCNFRRPLDDAWLHVQLLREKNKKFLKTSVNVHQSLCNFTDFNSNDYFINRLLSFSAKYIRSVTCPFKGNVTINRFPTMFHIANAILEPSSYLLNTSVHKDDLQVVNMNISFVVGPKKFL